MEPTIIIPVEIPLTKGMVALIDAGDYERVRALSWFASWSGANWYAVSRTGGGGIYMHRFILDAPPELMVDHRFGNTLDNRRENIRTATQSQNLANQRKTRGASRFKGVYLRCDGRKWCAQIKLAGQPTQYLGSFDTEEAAALAYNQAAITGNGEFARLNVLEGAA